MKFLKSKPDIIIAVLCIVIAMAAAFYAGWQRLMIETTHKQSVVLLQWDQVRDSAARENKTTNEILEAFSPYVGAILFKEQTVEDLENEGTAVFYSGTELLLAENPALLPGGFSEKDNYVFFKNKDDLQRVKQQIDQKTQPEACRTFTTADGRQGLALTLPYSDLKTMGVGFSSSGFDAAEAAGLSLVLQIRDYPYGSFTTDTVRLYQKQLAGRDLLAIGFNDNTIPGVNLPDQQWGQIRDVWAEVIQGLNASFVYMEFSPQKGAQSLGLAMDQHVLRLHSISEAEMKTTVSENTALDRLQLAASERNQKLLLVRFIIGVPLEQNIAYTQHIQQVLWQKGVMMQTPAEAQPLYPQNSILLLCALGVTAGAYLLYLRFKLPRKYGMVLFALAMLVAGGLIITERISLLQKLFAFMSVVVFPSLALCTFLPLKKQSLLKAIGLLIITTACSLIGALLMVGILADGNYMLGLNIFAGVKLAHLLPIMIVGVFFFFVIDGWREGINKFIALLKNPVTFACALIGVVILAVIAYYLMRTGNDNPNSVSSLERLFRAHLSDLLYARPRTKEFAFGHPLLLIVYYYGYKYRMFPVLLLASIGQISLVNTFAHIHTPLVMSVLRTVNGLWLGIILGIMAILLINIIVKIINKDRKRLLSERYQQ
ncbi:MAG: DUF5693 family protein [Clostridia bacterium]|nr:DUF5693 family protein [Clostridia bacterium]